MSPRAGADTGSDAPGGAPGKRARAIAGESLPAPGRPVRGSDSGRPIMALLDLLGRRWALRVIWELRDQPLAFRALQERCAGMSSSVLNQRLQELRGADVVELGRDGYRLTGEGRRLLEAYPPLNAWAERWAAREARG
jgi:DNA-binding HxlR family transcriptional regulator